MTKSLYSNQDGIRIKDPYIGDELRVLLEMSVYANGRTCISANSYYIPEFGIWEPYLKLTVNVPLAELSDEKCAFLNMPHKQELVDGVVRYVPMNSGYIADMMDEYHLGIPTGRFVDSGTCEYPEYRLDMEQIKKYT